MYNQTPAQVEAEKQLNKQGFKFTNWIDAQTENENEGCMVFQRRPNKFTTEYREVAPDGTIN